MTATAAAALTPDQEEILTLRDRVFELEEKNAELRRLIVGPEFPVIYPPEWLLTVSESKILTSLMTAQDGRRSGSDIRSMLYHRHDAHGHNIVSVFISRLRNKLGRFGIRITTRRGLGYELSAADRLIVSTKIEKWKSGEQDRDRTMTAQPQNQNANPS